MKKVFITRKLPGEPEQLIKAEGFSVKVYREDRAIPRDLLIRHAKDADALIPMISEKIDKEIIDELRKCKIIANCAVGFNNIDVEYARHKILLLQTHRTS